MIRFLRRTRSCWRCWSRRSYFGYYMLALVGLSIFKSETAAWLSAAAVLVKYDNSFGFLIENWTKHPSVMRGWVILSCSTASGTIRVALIWPERYTLHCFILVNILLLIWELHKPCLICKSTATAQVCEKVVTNETNTENGVSDPLDSAHAMGFNFGPPLSF